MAAGVTGQTLTAEEVFEVGAAREERIYCAAEAVIPRIAEAIA